MDNLGKRIYDLRKVRGMTLEQVGLAVGVGRSTVRKWENGIIANMRRDKIKKLADALGTTPAYIMGWTDDSDLDVAPGIAEFRTPSVRRGVPIPVLGAVAAGIPIDAVEDILDYEEITPELAATGEFFALKIKGQSMEPRMLDGDVVIVRRQDDADTGDIAVVLVNGDEATVKKIRKQADGLSLIPNNPSYDIMFYTPAQIQQLPVRIIGKVVELRGKM